MKNKYVLRYSLILYILLLLGCDNSGPAYIQAPVPIVSLVSSVDNINVSENVSIDIAVDNLDEVFGISFEILYNSTRLEIIGSSGLNDYTNSSSDQSFTGPITYTDAINGKYSFAMSGGNIDGVIYTISFTAKSAGEASIGLENVYLIDSSGNRISNYNSLSLSDPIIVVISE